MQFYFETVLLTCEQSCSIYYSLDVDNPLQAEVPPGTCGVSD